MIYARGTGTIRLCVALLITFVSSEACRPVAPERVLPERVSLVQLLANPSTFDAQKIQVAGFFVFEEENHTLYLSAEDADNGLTNGGIELNFYHSPFPPTAPQRLSRKYVSLIGIFHVHGFSQWPLKLQSGIQPPLLTNIEQIRTPPYWYGPSELKKVDQIP